MKRSTISRRSVVRALVLSSVFGLLPGCRLLFWHAGEPLPSVDGPEDPSLLIGTHGTLVAVDRLEPTLLQVVSLPGLERRGVPLLGYATTIRGPDAEGRVVYLDPDYGDCNPCYSLHVVSLRTGCESLLVKRRGSLDPASAVALSPTGGLLSFTSSIDRGGYDYTPWKLEVIDIATGHSTPVEGAITQHHPLWFPDAQHLAFVEWRDKDRSTITSILDVQSGERRVLREGPTRALARGISQDGQSVLFGEGDPLCRVDAATGRVLDEQVQVRGFLFQSSDPTASWVVVADLGSSKVLYDGRPTTGTEQQLVCGYSSGAKWTIKLCDTRTGAFVTVLPHVWGDVSYGAFEF